MFLESLSSNLCSPQVVFSSNEDLEGGDQQTSLILSTEEAIQEEEVAVEDTGSEQQFGVFKDFDFLDVELEDAEVRAMCQSFKCRPLICGNPLTPNDEKKIRLNQSRYFISM